MMDDNNNEEYKKLLFENSIGNSNLYNYINYIL